jgi:Mn2+/Fe2+ NRAMP family transporter
LFNNGIHNIESAEQAAAALEPLAGKWASLLFTVGIFGVGLLAVPVLAGSSAYAVSELFKWKEGLYKKYSLAKGFYGVIIASLLVGLAMNFIGINPIKALYFAAIVNGVTAPVLLYFIFKLGRDKKIMGDFVNPRWVNVFGSLTVILMGGAAIVLLLMTLGVI